MNRGIILTGPPGNGKTMLCRYIERQCLQNNFTCSTSTASAIDKAYKDNELVSIFTGSDVIFYDDIDIAYLNRANDGKMACAILTAMDGMCKNRDFMVRIFTTNEEINHLDPAFVRPGRIDKIIRLQKPSAELRQKTFESWPKELVQSIKLKDALDSTSDFSFAELEAIKISMVQDFLLSGGEWSFNRALKQVQTSRHGFAQRKQVGFV